MRFLVLPLLFGLAVSSPAQETRPAEERGAPVPAGVELALAAWRTQHGSSWRIRRDHGTGFARFLHGGSRDFGVRPVSDGDFVDLARTAARETEALHGVRIDTLAEDDVTFLPLGLAGSTDKMTVRFRQRFGGVDVVGGSLHVLLDLEGRILSVDNQALPALADFDVTPGYAADQAELFARAFFELDTGFPPTRATEARLLVDQVAEGKLRGPRLVWEVSVFHAEPGFETVGTRYRLDAKRGGVVSRTPAVHNDVSGQVLSRATPGSKPDGASNPTTSQPMPHLVVTSAQGSAVTDSDGNFTIPGASAPLSVTVQYAGTFVNVNDQGGSDYSLSTTLNASSGNVVTMNSSPNANTTAEANAALWIGKMRDWTRSVNAGDATSDFLAPANVNIASACNAYYDGVSVNFFAAGGSCVNSSYSSVVLHEMGHWLNDLYQSYNAGDGFGEGNADVYSMYILDNPIVGEDFAGTGNHIRVGTNTRAFCGDCCGGCYGEVHDDGEVLMGALWKVRSRLQATHGAANGGMIADLLFNSWMNAYDDHEIKTIIEDHWLTLDDDNGNIYDGTPNRAEIDGGFTDQGFPGVALRNLTITDVTALPDTTDQDGPYAVGADVVANFAAGVAGVELLYRVGGGAFSSVAMANAGGTSWSGEIPGQVSPAKVEYYVRATDTAAGTTSEPFTAPSDLLYFLVGKRVTHWIDDFESGVNGWTHQDNIGAQDDWQLSSQQGLDGAAGKSGDPSSAWSGTNIWGNDLGPSGFNGAYSNDVDNSLLSPVLDLLGVEGAHLRFRRWLTVEWAIYDHARVLVNGIEVWRNPVEGGDLIDTAWTEQVIDISSIADGNSSVQLQWNLRSDGGVTFGGWNIDDVEILSAAAVPHAAFAGTPLSGTAPLSVDFTDASTGGATSWSWDFGDGGSSTLASPTHVYAAAGSYTVGLTVSGPCGTHAETKTDYVTVDPGTPAPVASFTTDRQVVLRPQPVTFTDTSSGSVTSWSWDFGDGEASAEQHPVHRYRKPGLYTVKLTATGPGGSDAETKTDHVQVLALPPVAISGVPLVVL